MFWKGLSKIYVQYKNYVKKRRAYSVYLVCGYNW